MITDDAAEPLEAIPVERSENPLGTILAWLGVVVVVLVVGWWVWNRWIDPPVGGTIDRYVHDGGEVFESPLDEFRATFPTKYRRVTSTNAFGTIVAVNSNPGGGYEFSVTKTPQPESALESYTDSLNQAVVQLASGAGAEIVSQDKPTPIIDVAVANVVYRKGDTYWNVRLLLLRNRLYTVLAKTPNDDPAPFDRLKTSFQILGPH